MGTMALPLTDRARRVLRDADVERGHLGHPVLTSQHVFWALLREQGSVATLVLKDLQFDPSVVAKRLGPDWHATGPAKGNEDPIAAAVASASDLGHPYVDTAHLLLGLLRGQSRIGRLLRAEALSYGAASEATRRFWT